MRRWERRMCVARNRVCVCELIDFGRTPTGALVTSPGGLVLTSFFPREAQRTMLHQVPLSKSLLQCSIVESSRGTPKCTISLVKKSKGHRKKLLLAHTDMLYSI